MNRTEWLKEIQQRAKSLYDHIAPQYWVTFGVDENATHRVYLQQFLERVAPGGTILSAACGAGRYDGFLLAAGHAVIGIDQSAGMLARAKERYPAVQYQQMALQAMNFQEDFAGVICMDAMEHICPEDYPRILRGFQAALKPGGVLYFTADRAEEPDFDLDVYYAQAKAVGLPVVYGEVVDDAAYALAIAQEPLAVSGPQSDMAVYHYYPPLAQVRTWIAQAGLTVEVEGAGSGFHHFIARKQ